MLYNLRIEILWLAFLFKNKAINQQANLLIDLLFFYDFVPT